MLHSERVEDLVTPSRRCVREGDTEVRHKITGKGEHRHLFLFNDLVVIASAKGHSRFQFRKAMLWADCRFIVISEQGKVMTYDPFSFEFIIFCVVLTNWVGFILNLEIISQVKHGFEIAHEGQRYIFSCESKKSQDDWVADFKMMTKELKLKKLEAAKKGVKKER